MEYRRGTCFLALPQMLLPVPSWNQQRRVLLTFCLQVSQGQCVRTLSEWPSFWLSPGLEDHWTVSRSLTHPSPVVIVAVTPPYLLELLTKSSGLPKISLEPSHMGPAFILTCRKQRLLVWPWNIPAIKKFPKWNLPSERGFSGASCRIMGNAGCDGMYTVNLQLCGDPGSLGSGRLWLLPWRLSCFGEGGGPTSYFLAGHLLCLITLCPLCLC